MGFTGEVLHSVDLVLGYGTIEILRSGTVGADVGSGLGVVLLHILVELAGALEVEPAHLLATELDGTLVEDDVEGGIAAQRIVGAGLGTHTAQRIDGCHGTRGVALTQLGLSLDQIHLGQTQHDGVAVGDVVAGIVEVDVALVEVEELLDAGEGAPAANLIAVVALVAIHIRSGLGSLGRFGGGRVGAGVYGDNRCTRLSTGCRTTPC